jgi:hypothetical protein
MRLGEVLADRDLVIVVPAPGSRPRRSQGTLSRGSPNSGRETIRPVTGSP